MHKWMSVLGIALCVGCSSSSNDAPQTTEQNKPDAALPSSSTSTSSTSTSSSSTSSSSTSSSSTSSSSTSSSSGFAGPGEENRLSVSGSDTGAIGNEIVFDYFAFRENANGGDIFLLATNDSLVLDLTLAELGEFDEDDVSIGRLSSNRTTLNVWPNGMVLSLEKEGQLWRYSLVCDASNEAGDCESFSIDPEARTLTLVGAELLPIPEDNNPATAPISLSGVLKWAEADTVATGKPINDRPTESEGTPATLSDIQGVWDASTTQFGEKDEFYLVFDGNTYSEYDYDGDSAGNGDNCYYVETGTIGDLGDGKFNTIDSQGEKEIVSIHVEGENLNLLFLTLRPTTRQPSDLVPEC